VCSSDLLVDLTKHIRLHGVYEVWNAAPLNFVARIPVRSAPLFDTFEVKPEAAPADIETAISTVREYLRDSGAGGQVLEEAKAEFRRLEKVRHNLVMARWAVRNLAVMLQTKPYSAWTPSMDLLPSGTTGNEWIYLDHSFAAVTGTIVDWEGDDEAFVVEFPDKARRRVAIDGSVTELAPQAKISNVYASEAVVRGARAYLRSVTRPDFTIASAPLADEDRFQVRWGKGPSTEDYVWLREAARSDDASAASRWVQELLLPEILLDERDIDASAGSLLEPIVSFSNWARGEAALIPGEFPQEVFWVSSLSTYLGQVDNGGHGQFLANFGWLPAMTGACERGLAAIGADDYAAIFAELKALVESNHERARRMAKAFGEKDPAIKVLDERFHALAATGRAMWQASDWIRQSPRLRPLPNAELLVRKAEILKANTLRKQRIEGARERAGERMRSQPAWSLAEKLCGMAGLILLKLNPVGGPFALSAYKIKSARRYGYQLNIETNRGDLAVFFLDKYGLLGRRAAVLATMLGGPLSTTTISRADYEEIVPADVRERLR